MAGRARWIGVAALAAIAGIAAFALLIGETERAETRDTPIVASGMQPAHAGAPDAAADDETTVAATDARTERDAGAPAPRGLAPIELATVHGKVVLADGGPPRHAVVGLRTGDDEVDFREIVGRVGGLREFRRLQRTSELELRVRALGGWKPSFETEARADGAFEIKIPKKLGRFTFAARADGAVYAKAEAFDLNQAHSEAGCVLVLDRAATLKGTITDAQGRPARGGRAVVWMSAGPRQRSIWYQEKRYQDADAEGRFTFAWLPRGSCSVVAGAPGCAPSSRWNVQVRPGETTEVALQLRTGNSLAGNVVDAKGPVAGVCVTAREKVGRMATLPGSGVAITDAQGRFRIDELAAGKQQVAVARDGAQTKLAPEALVVEVPRPADAPELTIVLDEGLSVAGRVVDGQGRGVAEAEVVVDPSWWNGRAEPLKGKRITRQSAITAADGGFRIAGLGDGPFTVRASIEDVGSAERKDVPAGTIDLELAIAGPTGIAGRVVDATTGAPIEHFRVVAHQGDATPWDMMWRRSRGEKAFDAADGAFRIEGLAPGTFRVAASAEGYVDAIEDGVEVRAGEVTPGSIVKLRPATTLRGRVVDAVSGEPIAGAQVQHRASDTDENTWWDSGEAETGADGTFELRGLEPDNIAVLAWHDAYAEGESVAVPAAAGGVQEIGPIALVRGGAVEGVAVGEGGKPMANGQVNAYVMQPEGGRSLKHGYRNATADAAGAFHIEGLYPGKWRVQAQPAVLDGDWAAAQQKQIYSDVDVDVAAGRTTRVEFRPPRTGGCTVRGRIVRGGEPVARASVYLWIMKPGGEVSSDDRGFQSQTDADGRFALEHVPAGEGHLNVWSWGGTGGASVARSITVPDAPQLDFDITLSNGGEVAGRVTRKSDGRPAANVTVQANMTSSDGAQSSGNSTSDAEGRYRISGLAPGRYQVQAGGDGMVRYAGMKNDGSLAPQSRSVEVTEGGTATADFALEAGARATVEVVMPDGSPASGCWVSLERADGSAESTGDGAMTNDKGIGRIDGVAPGTYRAQTQKEGWPFARSEPVTVEAGVEARFRVQLRKGVTVRVRAVTADDAPIAIESASAMDAAGLYVAWAGGAPGSVELLVPPGKNKVQVKCGEMSGSAEVEVGNAPPPEIVVKVEKRS